MCPKEEGGKKAPSSGENVGHRTTYWLKLTNCPVVRREVLDFAVQVVKGIDFNGATEDGGITEGPSVTPPGLGS